MFLFSVAITYAEILKSAICLNINIIITNKKMHIIYLLFCLVLEKITFVAVALLVEAGDGPGAHVQEWPPRPHDDYIEDPN